MLFMYTVKEPTADQALIINKAELILHHMSSTSHSLSDTRIEVSDASNLSLSVFLSVQQATFSCGVARKQVQLVRVSRGTFYLSPPGGTFLHSEESSTASGTLVHFAAACTTI